MSTPDSVYLSTRELHDLLTPVLPHASTDKAFPEMGVIRLEVRDNTLYAVATDRYTMAATRHRLQEPAADTEIAIGSADAAALIRVFKYTHKDDPMLQLVVGTVEAETVLDPADRPALTVSAKDGNTLVVPGREGKALTTWRNIIAKALHREQKPVSPHLLLTAAYLPRWIKAVGNASSLSMHAGATFKDPIVVRAGDHFIGIWAPRRIESDARLENSPWCRELPLDTEPAEDAQAQTRGAA